MSVFKKCTCCNHPWFSRDEFLEDRKLHLVGYQVNFGELELGYFLFNHLTCLSTIAVPAGMFRDLYDGPVFSERKTDTENCPGYCGDRDILDPCDQECECAYVREIIQVVQNWPKNKDQPARVAQAL
jgi:hypothetical protein